MDAAASAMLLTRAQMSTTSFVEGSRGGDRISDYKHMLAVLDYILRSAPDWTTAASGVGLVGLPMFAVMDSVLGTTNGYAAFLDPDVNVHMKDILDEWGMYLQSSASRHVLDTHELGWFCPTAIQALTRCANEPSQSNHKFDEFYDCDSNDAHYGFTSWDDFFTRRIRTGVRPVAEPDDDDVLVHACESVAYNLEEGVNLRDSFFVKGQPYSPQDMLANDPLAAYFARGTVYQAFLSALAYHRWHAPVSGVVRRAFVQVGTYFSLPSWMGVASMGDNPDRMVPSQSYLSAMATRGIVIIEADNREIGLVAFVAVGMSEVSTCDVTVREGQHVVKGDETGMFRFGGSSYCLLFRHDLRLDGLPDVQNEESCAVRSKLATVGR
ncbi:hypothetical protein EsDP_00000675 [Epichloe bromicola]|uniref:L-tryptophan decarboxylase PsiD-like domain-containing protein n=1 Tax=Epichloe bromicola TaxID=79588 RepID=A0ABQ0CFN1_9HYPO